MSKPPVVKGVTLNEIWQKIKSEKIFETDLECEPSYVPWVFMSNVIQRSLARMVGQGPFGPVTVKCTKDGSLATVPRGGAFDDYERIDHYFSAANQEHEFEFSQQVSRVDIFTYEGTIEYQLTRDLIKAYGDTIELFEDSFYSLDFYTQRIKATSRQYQPRAAGSADGTTAFKLIDSGQTFTTKGSKIGDVAINFDDSTFATVTALDSETQLSVSKDIFVSGDDYALNSTRSTVVGWFREVD